jgi:hypothetical protein
VEVAAGGEVDVAVRAGLLREGISLGLLRHVVRHEDGLAGVLEAVEVAHGLVGLPGGLAPGAVVEEVLLANTADGLDVVGVDGDPGVLDEYLEVGAPF